MEGSWHLYKPGSRWLSPGFQARVILANDAWQAVGFQLGIVELVARNDEASVVGNLGPDLLGPDWSPEEASRRLLLQREAPIGVALLDQRNLAGLGTLYRSETLFLAGVHPETTVDQVRDLPRALDLASKLIQANKDRAAQITTGNQRRGEEHWVFERQGRPCRRCGTRIQRNRIGPTGKERPSYWCPSCQPAG
jgi:endonuclease-8